MKFFFSGDILRRFRIFVIGTIAVCTFLSLLYLVYIAKLVEKYTIAGTGGDLCFIMYSSSGGMIKGDKTIYDVIKNTADKINDSGYDSVIIEPEEPEELSKEVIKSMKKNKKYILLDISSGNAVINKNTLLIRLQNKDTVRYKENLESAEAVKKYLNDKDIKVNIITDTKSSVNQNIGCCSLKLEISKNNTFDEAKNIILNAVYSLMN